MLCNQTTIKNRTCGIAWVDSADRSTSCPHRQVQGKELDTVGTVDRGHTAPSEPHPYEGTGCLDNHRLQLGIAHLLASQPINLQRNIQSVVNESSLSLQSVV